MGPVAEPTGDGGGYAGETSSTPIMCEGPSSEHAASCVETSLTEEEILTCTRVLQRLHENRALLEGPQFRPVRKALMPLLDDIRARLPDKGATDEKDRKKHEKLMKRQRRQIQLESD